MNHSTFDLVGYNCKIQVTTAVNTATTILLVLRESYFGTNVNCFKLFRLINISMFAFSTNKSTSFEETQKQPLHAYVFDLSDGFAPQHLKGLFLYNFPHQIRYKSAYRYGLCKSACVTRVPPVNFEKSNSVPVTIIWFSPR